MPLDGKLLAQAKAALAEKRRRQESLYTARVNRVYSKAPRVKELDAELSETMLGVIAAALGTGEGASETVEKIRLKTTALQAERRKELAKAGFSETWLDEEYLCQTCKDTGADGNSICACLMELYKNELRKSLSSLLKLGSETFENFNLQYYDDTPDPNTGFSPRQNMEFVYETCVEYARKFGKRSMNLFFTGATGLGKTFLSACIARVAADGGHSVVYDTAGSVFAKFEEHKFSRGDAAESGAETRRCLTCDLLILDDLGTEMTTAFTISTLYELINTRLITGKKTIISSNLSISDLRRRYSEQIMSRLEGEYQVLYFFGEDIRKLR